MTSLKNSMKSDVEERFGLEYGLDIYISSSRWISTNMGAIEIRSLNIFNSKYVLARTDTATDKDYLDIERVIGHEYFHNWTGNQVDLPRLVPAQPERRFNRLPQSGLSS
ncbi:M1 family aminopeptidase [Escherichia coli]